MNKSRDFVVIGSQAMKHHFPDFPRIPHDTDVVLRDSMYQKVVQDESDIEVWQESSSGREDSFIIKYVGYDKPFEYLIADGIISLELVLDQLCDSSVYAPIEVLYSLKKAHIHFPIKFQKHIGDLMFMREKLRQIKGIKLEDDLNSVSDLLDELPALTLIHFKETEKRLGKLKTPKMTGEDTKKFFGKSKKYVTSYFVHDDMHKAVAIMHEGSPVYEKILKDDAQVETDQNKWNQLTLQQKIWCVLEEVYVIALERKMIPQQFEYIVKNPMTEKEAFDWALMRVCTTLCDGFFREFAVKAYGEIQNQYNPDYVTLFFKNIKQYDTNYEKTKSEERRRESTVEVRTEDSGNEIKDHKHKDTILS